MDAVTGASAAATARVALFHPYRCDRPSDLRLHAAEIRGSHAGTALLTAMGWTWLVATE
jgi:hypothetical protein